MPKNRSKELSRACKKRKEKKSCMFTGVMSTREHRMRAPCAAAFGASRHKMVRCSQCAQPSWVCLDCWGAIADKTKSLTAERAKRARKLKLMQHPVYDALAGGVDFKQLSADAAAGRSVAAGTTEGGGVLMKDCNGEWCWQEAGCPMCVDFPFPEPKPSLSLAASLAMPNVLLSLTETGSICGCSAVGHQHMQQVSDQQAAILTLSVKLHPSPTLNPNRTLPPSTPDQNPLQIKVHVYVLGDVLTAEEEEATVSRLLDANARVRLFHEHQNHYSGASRLATVQVYQVLMRMLMHTHMHNMHTRMQMPVAAVIGLGVPFRAPPLRASRALDGVYTAAIGRGPGRGAGWLREAAAEDGSGSGSGGVGGGEGGEGSEGGEGDAMPAWVSICGGEVDWMVASTT